MTENQVILGGVDYSGVAGSELRRVMVGPPAPPTVQCPSTKVYRDQERKLQHHTIVGCGKLTPDVRDDEGFVDCEHCGIFWKPECEEQERA